jgi:spore coat polysaccharide biosynthesis protein SpsF
MFCRNKMTVGIILQARMGSTRLPGKVMLKVLGKPLLELQIERLKRIPQINRIIVATSTKEEEKPIVNLVKSLKGVDLFKGSEKNVLDRFYRAASFFKLDVILRLTSDCPIIDPQVVHKVLTKFLTSSEKIDYASNVFPRTYPRGLDTEVFSFRALEFAHREATLESEREHVTPFIWSNPVRFPRENVYNAEDLSHFRWTVDTPEDFELIERIYMSLYRSNPLFNLEDCVRLLKEHPEWEKINSHIEQKAN